MEEFIPSAFSSTSRVPNFSHAVLPCTKMQRWAHFCISHVYSNSWNFQFQSSFSSRSFPLWLSSLLYILILLFHYHSLSTPQATTLCFLGTKRKARSTLKGVPTAFSATWSLECKGQLKALLRYASKSDLTAVLGMFMSVRKGGMYRTFELCPGCRGMREKNLDPWAGKT